MDWGNVTADELISALREVDWRMPPRPLTEFFSVSRFAVPGSRDKWLSRLKCNVYYYRTNYFGLVLLCLGVAFARNMLSIFPVCLTAFALLCTNDTFSIAINDQLTQLVRSINPPLASKLRAPLAGPGKSGSRQSLYILGQKRQHVVLGLSVVSAALLYLTSAVVTVAGGLLLGLGATSLHASLRTPNLKARLSSYRADFRAVWRGNNSFADL